MKVYSVLGVIWLGLCMVGGVISFQEFRYIHWLEEGKVTERWVWSAGGVAVYSIGAMASVFLLRGVLWARIVISLAGLFNVILCGLAFGVGNASGWIQLLLVSTAIFSWLSACVLLIPKRYVT